MNTFAKIGLWLLLLLPVTLPAQDIVPRPNPPRLVNDLANVLSPEEEAALEQKLVAYDDSTSNQVAVLLISTLNDYPIEEYALKLYREWGIGNKTTNNGVLIIAAIDDRKLRIETGYGLEGAIFVVAIITRGSMRPPLQSLRRLPENTRHQKIIAAGVRRKSFHSVSLSA